MNNSIFSKAIDFIKNIDYKTLMEKAAQVAGYAQDVQNMYMRTSEKRNREENENKTEEQFYYSEVENNENTYNVGIVDFMRKQLHTYNQKISDYLEIDEQEIPSLFRDFKDYLNEEEISDEKFNSVVSQFTSIFLKLNVDSGLETKIGSESFSKLLSIIVSHGMRISKVFYEFSEDLIDSIELKERLKKQYQRFLITIKDFIEESPPLKEYAKDIMMFATGKKAAAIVSFIGKITNTIFKVYNKQKEKFKESVKQTQSKFETKDKNKNEIKISSEKESVYNNEVEGYE